MPVVATWWKVPGKLATVYAFGCELRRALHPKSALPASATESLHESPGPGRAY
jgi:hypothetical protein